VARVPDWPERLQEQISIARHKTYRLGQHDCFIFACACAKAMTGVDYFAKFGGQYKSRTESLRQIRKFGGSGAAEAVDRLVGADRRRTILQARRGDWVLYADSNGEHLGICIGARCMVLNEEGLGSVAMQDCITAWDIS
jgi:hypothetical protein